MSFRSSLRALAPLLALLAVLATSPSRAQNTSPATTPAAPPAPTSNASPPAAAVSTDELQGLVNTIQDPTARQKLVQQLQALIEARRHVEPKGPSVLSTFFATLSEEADAVSGEVLAAAAVVVDAPRLVSWIRDRAADQSARHGAVEIATKLAIVFGLAVLADWIVWFLLRRPARRLGTRAGEDLTQQILFLLVGAALDALPILSFAAIAYFVLPLTDPRFGTQHVAQAVINAYLWSRIICTAARVLLLSPSALALYPLSEETRNYLYIWVRRFTNLAVYGYAVTEIAWWLSAPGAIYAVLLRIIVLLLGVLAIVFVLQNRTTVAEWLRGDPAGNATRRTGWRLLRHRLADSWHILAIIYLLGTFGVFALHIEGGILILLRATVITAVVVLAAALGVQLVQRASQRGFAVSPELKSRFPTIEARANRYIPALTVVLSAVIYVLAALALLQAWGIDSFVWFQAVAQSRAAGSVAGILIAFAVALAVWELFVSALERHMQRLEGDSRRRARARTMFPFLRLVMLVVLAVVVAFVVLGEVGINVGALIAGAGVFGLIAGLGSQSILKDIMTSIAVLIDDTFAVGDVIIVANGVRGTVESIALRTIRLRDTQGAILTVPFSEVKIIHNLSKDLSYYVAEISVSYLEDVDKVIALLKQVAEAQRQDPEFKSLILEPLEVFGLDRFEPGAYIVQVRLVTQPTRQWIVGREFNRRVKRAFDEHGIAMRSDFQQPVIRPEPDAAPKPSPGPSKG